MGELYVRQKMKTIKLGFLLTILYSSYIHAGELPLWKQKLFACEYCILYEVQKDETKQKVCKILHVFWGNIDNNTKNPPGPLFAKRFPVGTYLLRCIDLDPKDGTFALRITAGTKKGINIDAGRLVKLEELRKLAKERKELVEQVVPHDG